MLHIIQLINHMLTRLEYEVSEVEEIFSQVESGAVTVEELIDVMLLEPLNQSAVARFYKSLPRWRSALAVVKMKLESEDSTEEGVI